MNPDASSTAVAQAATAPSAPTPEAAPEPATRRGRRVRRGRRPLGAAPWITAVCWAVGVAILLYPTAAAWISQLNQASLIGFYDEQVEHASPDGRVQLKNARAYNEALSSGALLSAGANAPVGAGESRDSGALPYRSQLVTPSGMMARLRLPAIDLDLPVFHGTDDDTLLRGLGHLEGTSLPVGGASTRSVITGHRGLASAEMFTNLDRVRTGDTFTIETFGEVLTYRVNDVTVVAPEDTETLHQVAGKDLVTLITCTPLGVNTHRILVTGERITPTPPADIAAAGKPSTVPNFPWWIPAFVGAILLAAAYLRWAGRPIRKTRTEPRHIPVEEHSE